MKYFLSAIIFVYCTFAFAQELDKVTIATNEVTEYVTDWAKNLPPKYRKRALSHVHSVVKHSLDYGVDPLRIAIFVSLESSWNPAAKGKLGEVGLMQVHAKEAKQGFDLTDPDQQIEAGVKWFRACLDMCGGDDKQAMNAYATGFCKKPWKGLVYRERLYQKAIAQFRKVAE